VRDAVPRHSYRKHGRCWSSDARLVGFVVRSTSISHAEKTVRNIEHGMRPLKAASEGALARLIEMIGSLHIISLTFSLIGLFISGAG